MGVGDPSWLMNGKYMFTVGLRGFTLKYSFYLWIIIYNGDWDNDIDNDYYNDDDNGSND